MIHPTNPDNGGPAFPVPIAPYGNGGIHASDDAGMTLRDYFAAKAMQALNSGSMAHDVITSLDYVAEAAYRMADAMLKARAQ